MISFEALLGTIVLIAIPCIVFVELFLILPFSSTLKMLYRTSRKSLYVIRSNNISDHWKEKAIPRYAFLTFKDTCRLAFFLVMCCATFTLSFLGVGFLFKYDFSQSLKSLLSLETQLSALIVGCSYAFVRTKLFSSNTETSGDYSLFSSIFHHIALNFRFVREMAFDMDCSFVRKERQLDTYQPPVFVCGLARGGTTILLEALYSTRVFSTLTYRNMPFVTAPYLWPKISKYFYQTAEKKERAHGDRLKVNFDSPEAFEEVFWLTFSDQQYVQKNSLAFQKTDNDLEKKYRRYVTNILTAEAATEEGRRYLAKNNNNLLRVDLIKKAFPESVILVPFRNPIDHASSLLKQHQRFSKMHNETPFTRKYMDWLGHHEFGANIKLFEVDEQYKDPVQENAQSLQFWVGYWSALYQYLLACYQKQLVFFDYDNLCRSPRAQLTKLATLLGLDASKLLQFADSILSAGNYTTDQNINSTVLSEAQKTHEKLIKAAL